MLPDSHESFSIFAEVAIALAGFSGIIITFGFRSAENLSPLEVRRLANLFILSGFVLIASLLAISLLHVTDIRPEIFWSAGSGIVFLLGTSWLGWDIYKVRLLTRGGAVINVALVAIFDSLGVMVLLLQLHNCFSMHTSWPIFVALTLVTAGAFQQFILLVHMRMQSKKADNT